MQVHEGEDGHGEARSRVLVDPIVHAHQIERLQGNPIKIMLAESKRRVERLELGSVSLLCLLRFIHEALV